MKVVQSESGEHPVLLDAVSSRTTVYVRKNVEEVTKEDDEGTRTIYKYTEEQWPLAEWQAKHLPELSEKVDLLMMMMLESEGILYG